MYQPYLSFRAKKKVMVMNRFALDHGRLAHGRDVTAWGGGTTALGF